jgi:hypothetical protein
MCTTDPLLYQWPEQPENVYFVDTLAQHQTEQWKMVLHILWLSRMHSIKLSSGE